MIAQNKTCDCCVRGKVLDEDTNEPIPFATAHVKNTEKYAQTDENGDFLIEGICPDNYTLSISILGYTRSDSQQDYEKGAISYHYLKPEISDLEEVTVQAQKAKENGTETISQSRLTKEEIISGPSSSLAASLSKLEGVTFASTGTNVQLPIIHGLSGNRILILNNGLKHAFQNWGSEHAPEIDIYAANNITVIKGAAGVQFGPEALSGAILVEPNPLLLDNPLYANVGTGFQTNGRGLNANAEIGIGTKKWSYFANGSYTRIGDRNAPNYNLTNTGKEEQAFSFGVRHHLDAWDFKVHYSFVDQNLALLRSSVTRSPDLFINSINANEPIIINPFSYDINEPNQLTQHQLAKAEIIWRYSDEAKIDFHVGVQQNKREEFDVRRSEELPIIDLDLLTYEYHLEWEHPTWKGLDGLIGVQYFNQNNDNNPGTQTTAFIPNYNSERVSAFVMEKVKFGQDIFEAGVRFDLETNDVRGRETNQDIFRDRYTFTNFTASVGYVWSLSENSTFRSNVGSAFRTPNVAELFSFGQQGYRSTFGLLRFTDNNGQFSTSEVIALEESEVDLERGYKFTNEFRITKDGNSHLLTAYANYIENFVFERPIGVFGTIRGPQPAFIIDQAEALFLGVDYTWKKEITDKILATYGLSYLWSRNIGENEPLIEQSPISTNLELQWDQGKWWVFDSSKWTIRPSYTFQQFQAPRTVTPQNLVDGTVEVTPDSEIFDFIDAPDGYFLLDLSWNVGLGDFNGSIIAQNLLNNGYRNYLNELRYFADEPGINVLFALNYSF
ncbi:MAG: TonB-dependent receptor [Bacteroidota bacterium]